MEKEEEKTIHPAFGQIEFSRISTNAKPKFYGSELSVDHYIQLRIHTSECIRSLTGDRYHNLKTILKLRLSPNQFSELITSMNIGTGTPCTLEFYNQQIVEEFKEHENRKEFMHRKFQERMREFAFKIAENKKIADGLIGKKNLSKSDQEQLKWHMQWIVQEVQSNIPFFAECFQEQMDKVVLEAKSEIEAAILNKVTKLGLEALHSQNKLIGS